MFGLLVSPPDGSLSSGSPDADAPLPSAVYVMGMRVFIASLTMFFAAPLVGYFWVRFSADSWPPPGVPSLPGLLWLGTVILVASSVTAQAALRTVRSGDERSAASWMAATLFLAFSFLGVQAINWNLMLEAHLTATTTLYGFTFYVLTGMHALHVIGGIIPMAVVTRRAFRGRYSAARHIGIESCVLYWHFLDAVWVILFASIYLTL